MTTITLDDPKNLLVDAPSSDAYGQMIEAAKGDCGLILRGIDWAVEKILHWSLIDAIMSPVAGDFNGVDALRCNWQSTGLALQAVSGNYTTIADSVDKAWRAPAATESQTVLRQHASAHGRQATACGLMSRQLGNMLKATQEVVTAVCGLLGLVEEIIVSLTAIKLAKMLIKPGGTIAKIIRWLNQAVDLIKSLVRLPPALAAAAAALTAIIAKCNIWLSFSSGALNSEAGKHIDNTSEAGFK